MVLSVSETPLTLDEYPRAILHLDADAFFASVEEALTPAWRGRPIVTGQERGVIACANYPAKARGIRRGIPLFEARRLCPDLLVLPSDYETYGLFSRRLFNIMRRYTPWVEEYSVDEGFADLTGLRQVFRASYEEIARRMKGEIQRELGLTVSVGLSLSKGLAKLCSKLKKPDGFVTVPGREIHTLLQATPVEKVWGFGPNTANLLHKFGVNTAYDFVNRPQGWVGRVLHKPGLDIWHELRGQSVNKVNPDVPPPKCTLVRSKTFTPATTDRELIYGQLMRNVEVAFAKLRRHCLRASVLGVVLRRQDFSHDGLEARLTRATSSTQAALPLIRGLYERAFQPRVEYRATMIVLAGFEDDRVEQAELFEDRPRLDSLRRLARATDALNEKFGRGAVSSGACLCLARAEPNPREQAPARREIVMKGEGAKRRLAIPRFAIAV
jgi:DNA polymerase-4/DNA polymerase V